MEGRRWVVVVGKERECWGREGWVWDLKDGVVRGDEVSWGYGLQICLLP